MTLTRAQALPVVVGAVLRDVDVSTPDSADYVYRTC